MSLRLAIGVDAGGTKTRAYGSLSADVAFDGPAANASSAGVEAAAAAIAGVVDAAARASGARPSAIFVAAAGAGRDEVARGIEERLRLRFAEATHVVVEDDARAALRVAVPAGPGIVLIAGTGSLAYAENGERRVRVGGAGYLLGDEGSGYAIGLAAAKLLARAFDGRTPRDETTDFTARALAASDRETLLARVYGEDFAPSRLAALAPAIVAFAGKGNRVATKIVQNAAQELGDLVKRAAVASDLLDRSPLVAFAGGLLRENTLLTFLLETRLAGEMPGAAVVRVRDEPALGALRFAESLLA